MAFRNLIIAGVLGISTIAVGCTSTRTQQSAGEYTQDAAITAKVKTALMSAEGVSAASVNVETFRNVVQLSGFVNSTAEAQRAVEVARGVDGVQSVKNDLRLKTK
ncbi:MAG: BON domain-containing protein [Pigmentiphaga sp.]|nr:BON domain-containing protein [Pigmentiphaga sp.]